MPDRMTTSDTGVFPVDARLAVSEAQLDHGASRRRVTVRLQHLLKKVDADVL